MSENTKDAVEAALRYLSTFPEAYANTEKIRDYIATLEAENTHLHMDHDERDHLRSECDRLEAEIREWKAAVASNAKLVGRNIELRDRVAELEEALRPLAEMVGGGPEWRLHSDRARELLNREET